MIASVRTKLNLFLITLLVLCTAAVVGLVKSPTTSADTCFANNIMPCGFTSASDFISKVKANAKGDYPAIYNYFGLSSSDYSRFQSSARPGTVFADGHVEVDGQTVATSAWQIGREKHSYDTPLAIGGNTYNRSTVKDDFAFHKFSSQPVMVMFDSKGVAQFTVMNVCGNPVKGTNVTPKYSCDLLQKSAVAGKENTYSFTTKASATDNAKVVKYTYDFGDGTNATTTSATEAVQHTYAKAGTYTASVTISVTVPGGQTVTTTSVTCKTVITVKEKPAPVQQCISVAGVLLNKEELKYEFTVTTSQSNGSTLKSASFNFGDGSSANDVAPTSGTTVKTSHSFAKEGKYTVVATVNFNTAAGVKNVTCQTAVDTGVTPMCATNPSLPANSPECKPCEFNAQLPADSPDCKKPEVLANVGPGNMIGLFTATSAVAGIGYRLFLLRRGNA
jgi:hypothetical protein